MTVTVVVVVVVASAVSCLVTTLSGRSTALRYGIRAKRDRLGVCAMGGMRDERGN